MIPHVYSSHGTHRFNESLHRSVMQIAQETVDALEGNLVCLALGGGYGRGEGGVWVTGEEERPYNDIDFTLVVHNASSIPAEKLRAISKRHEAILGIHVDFSRPLTIEDLRDWPHWLMWHDLLNGHIVVAGSSGTIIENAPAHLAEVPPAIEATRLLLNRGAGLLWAMRHRMGLESPPDEEFIRRNYWKLMLALGDALLICAGIYTSKCAGRDELFAKLCGKNEKVASLDLAVSYAQALEFKFWPSRFQTREVTNRQLAVAADLWGATLLIVEEHRTGDTFADIGSYTADKRLREPEQHTPKNLIRNVIRNLQRGRLSGVYPRETLYRTLPRLLGAFPAVTPEWQHESEDFLGTWRKFN